MIDSSFLFDLFLLLEVVGYMSLRNVGVIFQKTGSSYGPP
jgi:hypothetical protein